MEKGDQKKAAREERNLNPAEKTTGLSPSLLRLKATVLMLLDLCVLGGMLLGERVGEGGRTREEREAETPGHCTKVPETVRAGNIYVFSKL